MALFAGIWNNLWSLFPLEVQEAARRNTGPFVVSTAVLVLAFLALPLLAYPRKGTAIAGRYRTASRGRQAGLLVLGLALAGLAPFASTLLVRVLGR
jgi:hypothetical protein